MTPLEPLLPGEVRSEYLARVDGGAKADDIWHEGDGPPPVEAGSEKEFIVAVRRSNGKIYSFGATYLNAHQLNYEYGCPNEDKGCDGYQCENGCPTTGWFREIGDDGEGASYHRIDIKDGDKFMGWRHVPQWPVA